MNREKEQQWEEVWRNDGEKKLCNICKTSVYPDNPVSKKKNTYQLFQDTSAMADFFLKEKEWNGTKKI